MTYTYVSYCNDDSPGLAELPGYVPRRGEATGRSAKLTAEQVREIRRRYERGESQPALARAFGVTSGQISRIVQRISWPHV